METLQQTTSAGNLSGTFEARFADVAQVFVDNFEQRGEVGGSVCITLGGKTVVDLWGGKKSVKQIHRGTRIRCVWCIRAPKVWWRWRLICLSARVN